MREKFVLIEKTEEDLYITMTFWSPEINSKDEFDREFQKIINRYGKTKKCNSRGGVVELLYKVDNLGELESLSHSAYDMSLNLKSPYNIEINRVVIREAEVFYPDDLDEPILNLSVFSEEEIEKISLDLTQVVWSKKEYRQKIDSHGNSVSILVNEDFYNGLGHYVKKV